MFTFYSFISCKFYLSNNINTYMLYNFDIILCYKNVLNKNDLNDKYLKK